MAEYVTKEQVKEEILSWAKCITNPERLVTEDALYVIDALPPADVRPVVHGEWMKLDMHRGMEQYKCSVCQSVMYVPECMGEPMYLFCPMCNADMRGDAE